MDSITALNVQELRSQFRLQRQQVKIYHNLWLLYLNYLLCLLCGNYLLCLLFGNYMLCLLFKVVRYGWYVLSFSMAMYLRIVKGKTKKQECIPVGCVPPACWPYPSMHWAGEGVSQHALGGGCLLGGVCCGVSARGDWQTPSLWTEWQTGVKILPCRNFVVGGKNVIIFVVLFCRFLHTKKIFKQKDMIARNLLAR